MSFKRRLYIACRSEGVSVEFAKRFATKTELYHKSLYGRYWNEIRKEIEDCWYDTLAQSAKEAEDFLKMHEVSKWRVGF